MAVDTSGLLPGTEVQARGLRWEVVSSQSLGPQTLFRLRGLENAVLGQELDVLYPFEAVRPVRHDLRPDRAAPLTNWLVYHQAFLLEQALGPHALVAVQPGRLRIEPYQLVPVLRAIRMSRVRLFLADGVGLGKTVQAGLVITELIARRLAHRILIVSPAGPLLDQWKTEMSQRFGLRLEVIDRAKLEEVRRSTELGSNPFDHIPLGLVSVDFLKQERVLDQLERASYDAVVTDEAHHCMEIGRGQDREDSQRQDRQRAIQGKDRHADPGHAASPGAPEVHRNAKGPARPVGPGASPRVPRQAVQRRAGLHCLAKAECVHGCCVQGHVERRL